MRNLASFGCGIILLSGLVIGGWAGVAIFMLGGTILSAIIQTA